MTPRIPLFALLLSLALGAGCGGDEAGTGALSLTVEAEETITDGLAAGTERYEIQDGWSVTFSKYLVTIGEARVAIPGTEEHIEDETVHVLDLTQAPPSGFAGLWNLGDLSLGPYDIGYSTPAATADALRHASVEPADFDEMVAGGLTYLVEGSMTNPAGQSCDPDGVTGCVEANEISFRFAVPVPTNYGPCTAEEGVPGVTIVEGGTDATFTLHGDHLFFNGFPAGDEARIARYAQWIANSDTDRDGAVTQAELEAIPVADMAELDERYNLTEPPGDLTLTTMWDYVRAQLKSQGHFNGEGGCAADGEAHSHE